MQDKHRPCQDGMFSDTAPKRNIMPTLSRAQRWMSVQQYVCNYTESCHDKQRCVTMNSSVCKSSLDFLDLCSTVLQDKTRHPRGDLIKTRSDVSHLRVQKDVGTCTFIQQYPLIRRKTDLHSTTDCAPQLKVLMVAKLPLYQSQQTWK